MSHREQIDQIRHLREILCLFEGLDSSSQSLHQWSISGLERFRSNNKNWESPLGIFSNFSCTATRYRLLLRSPSIVNAVVVSVPEDPPLHFHYQQVAPVSLSCSLFPLSTHAFHFISCKCCTSSETEKSYSSQNNLLTSTMWTVVFSLPYTSSRTPHVICTGCFRNIRKEDLKISQKTYFGSLNISVDHLTFWDLKQC